MGKLFLILLILFGHISVRAQKKLVDTATPTAWPTLTARHISNDGKYVLYSVSSLKNGTRWIVQSTDSLWKRIMLNVNDALFAENSRWIVAKISTDSVGILDLAKDSLEYLSNIARVVIPKKGDGQVLVYLIKNRAKNLVVLNLQTRKKVEYRNVADFTLSDNGKALVMEQAILRDDSSSDVTLTWLDLLDGKMEIIGHGYRTTNTTFDEEGNQIVFYAKSESDPKVGPTLRYYREGMDSAGILVSSAMPGMEGNALIATKIPFFSPNDSGVFFL